MHRKNKIKESKTDGRKDELIRVFSGGVCRAVSLRVLCVKVQFEPLVLKHVWWRLETGNIPITAGEQDEDNALTKGGKH